MAFNQKVPVLTAFNQKKLCSQPLTVKTAALMAFNQKNSVANGI